MPIPCGIDPNVNIIQNAILALQSPQDATHPETRGKGSQLTP